MLATPTTCIRPIGPRGVQRAEFLLRLCPAWGRLTERRRVARLRERARSPGTKSWAVPGRLTATDTPGRAVARYIQTPKSRPDGCRSGSRSRGLALGGVNHRDRQFCEDFAINLRRPLRGVFVDCEGPRFRRSDRVSCAQTPHRLRSRFAICEGALWLAPIVSKISTHRLDRRLARPSTRLAFAWKHMRALSAPDSDRHVSGRHFVCSPVDHLADGARRHVGCGG